VNRPLLSVETEPYVGEQSRGLGSRDELIAALEAAALADRPKMLAIFALEGFDELEEQCGRRESEALLERLAGRLEREVSADASWYRPRHDEFALVLDGEVEISLVKLAHSPLAPGAGGSVALDGEPEGQPMGRILARRGHMALLPAGSAYRFRADQPGVILQQTVAGPDTLYRWSEICQSL